MGPGFPLRPSSRSASLLCRLAGGATFPITPFLFARRNARRVGSGAEERFGAILFLELFEGMLSSMTLKGELARQGRVFKKS
jgi:hypothetical protein